MAKDEGKAVEVYDETRKRWCKGKILYPVRVGALGKPDGWMVELEDGDRGAYDKEHLRFT